MIGDVIAGCVSEGQGGPERMSARQCPRVCMRVQSAHQGRGSGDGQRPVAELPQPRHVEVLPAALCCCVAMLRCVGVVRKSAETRGTNQTEAEAGAQHSGAMQEQESARKANETAQDARHWTLLGSAAGEARSRLPLNRLRGSLAKTEYWGPLTFARNRSAYTWCDWSMIGV